MSDRYKQLIFPHDVVPCRPESQPQRETPVKVSASVSSDKFEIGDRIVVGNKYWNPWFYGKEATITGFTENQSYKVVLDDGLKWVFSPEYVEKVKGKLLKPVEKVRGQTKNLPSNHYIEVKLIKGNYYRYARWREDGFKRSKYLGKCPLTESRI